MRNKDLILLLLSDSYTINDAEEGAALMKDFFEDIYFNKKKKPSKELFLEFLESKILDKDAKEKFLKWFDEWEKVLKVRKDVYKELSSIEKAIQALPIFVIAIPYEFPKEEIARIGQWIRAHTTQSALLDLRIDPEAVGGCRLSWRGRFGDFSLRYFMRLHEKEILSELKKENN